VHVWAGGAGLDGLEPALEQLRESVFAAGGPFDAAGVERAFDRVAGLLGVTTSGLAYDDFPAVFRGGRDFLGIWDGADAADTVAFDVQAGGHYYDAAHRHHVQSD